MSASGEHANNCGCRFRSIAPAHHDRLVRLEVDPFGPMVELVEMAATWGEVEHGEFEGVLSPDCWVEFAEQHTWQQPDRVLELMLSLWSMTLPCMHGADDNNTHGVNDSDMRVVNVERSVASRRQPAQAGTVTPILHAKSVRGAEQSA